jgi:hypothetical protein
MQGYQGGVLLLGGALGVAELFARKVPQNTVAALSTGSLPSTGNAKSFWTSNGGTLLLTVGFVGVTTYIAGLSDDAGKLMLALIIAVWLLFLVKNAGNLNSIFAGTGSENAIPIGTKKGS